MKELRLTSEIRDRLAFFESQDSSTCAACCKVACEFLQNGVNVKMYSSAASKLNVSAEELERAIVALMQTFTEAAKLKAEPEEIQTILSEMQPPLPSNLLSCVLENYSQVDGHLQKIITAMSPQYLPQYKDLRWRLDIDVDSRTACDLNNPSLSLQLLTQRNDSTQKVDLQADPSTVLHLTSEMEKALAELRTREYQKITKQIK